MATEEMPKILSSEVLDVLPGFANMLDFKSFMCLALSCKDMYKHCLNDRGIRIEVSEKRLNVTSGGGRPKFSWQVDNVSQIHREQYLAKLRQLPFNVTLERVYFENTQNDRSFRAGRDHLKEMNVKHIRKLEISGDFVAWTQLVPFLEEFEVKKLKVDTENVIPAEVLLFLLQLKLDSINYKSPVPLDALLQANSSIPKLKFTRLENISGKDFMQLLWMIQTGALPGLTIDLEAVNLDRGQGVPYDFEGPLPPDDRPLMFYRKNEYWFLHWHGGVTKAVTKIYYLVLFKCEKNDYPPILREEEDVLEDMNREMTRAINYKSPIGVDFRSIFYMNVRKVSCSRSLFSSFSEKFPMIDASHEGPLPAERPLYCKVSPLRYWLLNVNDILVECKWSNGYAKWNIRDSIDCAPSFDHSALEKYLIRKKLQNISEEFSINCGDKKVFESWFEGFRRLPMEYDGILPDDRPLLFEAKDSLIILPREGFVCKCAFGRDNLAYFFKCPSSMLPSILMKNENVEDLIRGGDVPEQDIRLDLEKFRSAFDQFKTIPFDYDGPFPEERPVIFAKTQNNDDGEIVEERLVIYDHKEIKATWKNGHAVFKEAEKRDFSPYLTESLLENLLKTKYDSGICRTLFVDLETIEKYLVLFKTLPYDYVGTIPEEDVVIFTKTKIKDGCRNREEASDSPDVMMTIWMLKEGSRVSCAIWGAEEPLKLEFKGIDSPKDVPSVLKTKEHLKQLLLKGQFGPYIIGPPRRFSSWLGDLNDLHACLREFTQLPFFFDDDLPEERPLVFELDDANWVILREDGSRFVCSCDEDEVRLFTSSDYDPPAVIDLY